MGSNPGLDNGEAFMRAQREAQRQAINAYWNQRYNPQNLPSLAQYPYLTPRAWTREEIEILRRQTGLTVVPYSPGERPEPEDTTGLKMLDEFLQRRKRDGNERKPGD